MLLQAAASCKAISACNGEECLRRFPESFEHFECIVGSWLLASHSNLSHAFSTLICLLPTCSVIKSDGVFSVLVYLTMETDLLHSAFSDHPSRKRGWSNGRLKSCLESQHKGGERKGCTGIRLDVRPCGCPIKMHRVTSFDHNSGLLVLHHLVFDLV